MMPEVKSTDLDSGGVGAAPELGRDLEGGPRRDALERVRYVLGHPCTWSASAC
ncbi:MAG: hypothetical protein M5U28_46565 [Sandaracinaceae bacterium]|nr:hypothetical protein [Sandaracinaceae bacterium]